MRGPSLQKTALASLTLHLTAFLVLFVLLRQTNHVLIPSQMTVSLVSPDIMSEPRGEDNAAVSRESEEPAAPHPEKIAEKDMKEAARQKEMVEKKIAALEVQAAKKRIEKIVRLRSIISLKAGGNRPKGGAQATGYPQGKGSTFDNYYSKITREIWQQWVFPDTGQKNLEAIISIRIFRNGMTTEPKIEKSSGNALFDRSAIRALAKASPLTPPPYEMEIGVRFYP
jgi:colicin import membrane protein